MATFLDVGYTTVDGVRIHARHWVPSGDRGELAVVLGHGFTGSSASPQVARICQRLSERGFAVLSPDFRGHGRSGGATTAGELEVLDVAAAVGWLRDAGYARVAILGFSMGGSAVLRYAGLPGGQATASDGGRWRPDADAVVSVSSPGMWFERGTRPMRVVHWVLEKRTGRAALRVAKRVRVSGRRWDPVPEAPKEVVGAIGVPLLLIHGDADHYFPLRHIEALSGAAAAHAEIWIEPGMTHAETGTTPELVDRIAAWLRVALSVPRPAGGPGAV